MKLFTLTQPWATLVAIGAKKIETRSFKTAYRGEIAIHAAKGVIGKASDFIELCQRPAFDRALSAHMHSLKKQTINTYLAEIPFGAVVAVVDLAMILSTNGHQLFHHTVAEGVEMKDGQMVAQSVDTVHYEKPAPESDEYAFGNYGPNRWMWFLENVRKLREPVPCRGVQGLRDLPPDIEVLVRAQI